MIDNIFKNNNIFMQSSVIVIVFSCQQCSFYGVKFAKCSWANSQSLFSDFKRQVIVIFQDLGKLLAELGNCSILWHRLECVKNGFAVQQILSKDLWSSWVKLIRF